MKKRVVAVLAALTLSVALVGCETDGECAGAGSLDEAAPMSMTDGNPKPNSTKKSKHRFDVDGCDD